jgi:hypothetical protein
MAGVTTVSVATPDWLKQRGGEVRTSKDGYSCSVYFAGQLQYVLIPIPAKGQYACRISETINGRRVENPTTYPTVAEAFKGGLENLKTYLGWGG